MRLFSGRPFWAEGRTWPGAPSQPVQGRRVKTRVLVIDTSTDYIAHIARRWPGRTLFVTDPAERARGPEPSPGAIDELLAPMTDPPAVLAAVQDHMARHGFTASGVACFDCESMYLSSRIARELGLPYPSCEAVLACRSKSISKERWRRAGLACPAAEEVRTVEEIETFRLRHGGTVLLKPLTGAGSELLFLCLDRPACERGVTALRRGLAERAGERMYAAFEAQGHRTDPRQVFVAEEYCAGQEYSCDFVIEGDLVRLVRLARKWPKPDPAPGITLAYQAPARLPDAISEDRFRDTLRRAASALGIDRALCMLDFLIDGDRLVLLEMAPRPGGDCLPQLLRACCGLDILGLELDVAGGRSFSLQDPDACQPLVGLRLFAPAAGCITAIETSSLMNDPRVREIHLKPRHGAGHRVVLPPEDYHSRVLGCVVFQPRTEDTITTDCRELQDLLGIRYDEEEPP